MAKKTLWTAILEKAGVEVEDTDGFRKKWWLDAENEGGGVSIPNSMAGHLYLTIGTERDFVTLDVFKGKAKIPQYAELREFFYENFEEVLDDWIKSGAAVINREIADFD